jgi:vacuolar protein sorting-associated protein 13A/C
MEFLTRSIRDVINGAISPYFENIDADGLCANLLSQMKVSLKDLKLKTAAFAAFDSLGLPLELKGGYIEELTLDMSGTGVASLAWAAMRGNSLPPILVMIKGLYVCIGPKNTSSVNRAALEMEYSEWMNAANEDDSKSAQKLVAQEKAETKAAQAAKDATAKQAQKADDDFQSVFDNLPGVPAALQDFVKDIALNIAVVVQKVHIRYEDALSNPSCAFATGFTLDEAAIMSAG